MRESRLKPRLFPLPFVCVMLLAHTPIAVAQIHATVLSESPLKTKIIDLPGSPVKIDTCRAFSRVYDQYSGVMSGVKYVAYVTLQNVSKKTIEAIGFTMSPHTVFNDGAGEPTTSLLLVNLAPGEAMPQDYPFTDGAKEPSYGNMINEWRSVYEVDCSVTRVRFSDGSTW